MKDRICSLLKIKSPELDRGYLFASGATVPVDTTDGFQTGCVFQKTDGGAGTAFYINEGSVTSCAFAAVAGLTADQEALLGATAGVVTASKAVIVDADKDAGDFRNLDCVNLDAGSSGVAGSVDVFASTASKGKLTFTCTDQAGDTAVSVVADEMAAARTIHLPDPGATSYLMQSTAQITLAEADVLDAASAGTVVASKAVVADASKDVGDFRNLDCQNLDAGASGSAGSVDVFPGTASKGKLAVTCTDQATDATVSLVVDEMAAARTVHLPDPGATSYLMQSTAQITLAEADVLDAVTPGTVTASKALVVDASRDLATLGAVTVDGVFKMASQDSGVAIDNSNPDGFSLHVKPVTDLTTPTNGVSSGLHMRYEVGADMTNQVSHAALFGQMRVKKDLADGEHCGVKGYVEISEVGTVIGGTATTVTSAGAFAVESDTNFELSTGYLCGVCVDSSVHASATISGSMIGVRVKKGSGKKSWPVGIGIDDDCCDAGISVGKCATGIQIKSGAAAAVAAMRFGASATEGLEVKVIDEVVTLTNAVETALTETVPSGAVILSVQANNDTLVVGDASGDNGLTKVGIGPTGDPDKYGKTADLIKNSKVDTLPDWAVLGSEETIVVKGCDNAGTAVTELFVAGGEVRVRIVYLACNSLDDTA